MLTFSTFKFSQISNFVCSVSYLGKLLVYRWSNCKPFQLPCRRFNDLFCIKCTDWHKKTLLWALHIKIRVIKHTTKSGANVTGVCASKEDGGLGSKCISSSVCSESWSSLCSSKNNFPLSDPFAVISYSSNISCSWKVKISLWKEVVLF